MSSDAREQNEILDVHIERRARVLDEDRPEEIRAIQAKLEALKENLSHWRSQLKSRQLSVKTLDELARRDLGELREDASWSRLAEPSELQPRLAQYAARERGVHDQILALEGQIRRGTIEAGDLGHQLEAKASPEVGMSAAIVVEIVIVRLKRDQRFEVV